MSSRTPRSSTRILATLLATAIATSCSPGWIKYIEHLYPEYLDNLSSCKSPQQMTGTMVKTYYAEKMGIDPKNIVMVSVMPCLAARKLAGW